MFGKRISQEGFARTSKRMLERNDGSSGLMDNWKRHHLSFHTISSINKNSSRSFWKSRMLYLSFLSSRLDAILESGVFLVLFSDERNELKENSRRLEILSRSLELILIVHWGEISIITEHYVKLIWLFTLKIHPENDYRVRRAEKRIRFVLKVF